MISGRSACASAVRTVQSASKVGPDRAAFAGLPSVASASSPSMSSGSGMTTGPGRPDRAS